MYTIVVADDETQIRRALISRVDWEKVGFRVVGEAENGVEALELVEELEPDLLLTDIRMPFLSGIELARQVREVRPATQIAFLSGYDDFTYAQQAIHYNIISYMLKPISAQEVTEELQNIKEKIDEKYRVFAMGEKANADTLFLPFVMPLLLDEFQEVDDPDRDEGLRDAAVDCGMISAEDQEMCYSVMTTSIIDEYGRNTTTEMNSNSIDLILKKYLRTVTFYLNGRILSLLLGTKSEFEKYLHIATEEIAQSVERILEKKCLIGIGRVETGLSCVRKAYMDAMKAMKHGREKMSGVYFISDVEQHKNSVTRIVEEALSIIETEYMNPEISLVSVSGQIAVSPNYLSASIKKVAGNTFVDLLSQKRIEIAKDLLLGTHMKVREISEKCGYSDQHYFSYCFKKYTGTSPNEFRRKSQEG